MTKAAIDQALQDAAMHGTGALFITPRSVVVPEHLLALATFVLGGMFAKHGTGKRRARRLWGKARGRR